MITTTTNTIEGRQIRQYLGLVTGEAIMGANVFSDFMASITDFIGGRSGTYESKFAEARETAIQELEEEAGVKGLKQSLVLTLTIRCLVPTTVC